MAKAKIGWGRKLEDTSWLAQTIKDKMHLEFERNGFTSRYSCLSTLRAIVQEADNESNEKIYYSMRDHKRQIIICEIPSLVSKHGTDFDLEGMRGRLLGLATRYTYDNGKCLVSALVTHDLNSCVIDDVGELLYRMAE